MPPPQNSRNCSPRNSSSAACSLTSWTRWRTWRARRSRGPHWTNLWTTFPPTEGCWWNLRTQRSLIWWGYMNTGPFGSLVLLLISVAFCVNKSYKCLFIISQQRGLLSVSLCNSYTGCVISAVYEELLSTKSIAWTQEKPNAVGVIWSLVCFSFSLTHCVTHCLI